MVHKKINKKRNKTKGREENKKELRIIWGRKKYSIPEIRKLSKTIRR